MTKEMKHKALVPAVLLCGIFIGAVVVLRTQNIGATILTEGKKVLFPIASEPDADPDNDGLKNWEEKIYKTDPRNPDTDGDGYVDGEEVASGYDPTVKAPGDAREGANTAAPRPLPKNLTTHLAQILTEKISSGQIDPSKETKVGMEDPTIPYNQEVFNEALAQIAARAKEYFVLPEVKDSDISISQTPTTYAEIGRYITAMGEAVKNNDDLIALKMSETEIIREGVANKNTAYLRILLSSYQNAAERAKKVTVPRDFADIHKKFIALLLFDIKIFDALERFQDDPATAAAAAETYPDTVDLFQRLSEELNAKIKSYQL